MHEDSDHDIPAVRRLRHPRRQKTTSIGTHDARPLLTKIALGASSGYKANRVVMNHSENGRRGRPHCRQFGGREGLGGDRINVTNVFGTTRPTLQAALEEHGTLYKQTEGALYNADEERKNSPARAVC